MKKILIQLDTDPAPSTFDRVVAVDAEVDQVFSYGGVTPDSVEPLVHGAIFTRGGADLANTAIFVGGSNVVAGEALVDRVLDLFLGPVRVSVMMDSNGCNTTAAAAVLSARKHLDFVGTTAVILGGTGPVGQRAAEFLVTAGAHVRIGSRSAERASATCAAIRKSIASNAQISAHGTAKPDDLERACQGAQLVIGAGAAGAELLPAQLRTSLSSLKVAIDLNAVPPLGIAGVEVFDKAVERGGVVCYGAIGVGGLKMKIHKAALRKLFVSNDQVLDRGSIYAIGAAL